MIPIDEITDEDFERHAFAILKRELWLIGSRPSAESGHGWRLRARSSSLARPSGGSGGYV
jgi:hypothetical protein